MFFKRQGFKINPIFSTSGTSSNRKIMMIIIIIKPAVPFNDETKTQTFKILSRKNMRRKDQYSIN